jgi:uncharacterized protein (TIRG00374 family)
MRKFLIAVVLLLGIVFILTRFTELENLILVLQRGSLVYLGLALLFQLAWIYNLSLFYQSVYRVLGMEARRMHIARLVTAAYFLSIIAPSGGLSGMAVFISDARRCNRPVGKVTIAGVLYVWFEYLGTLAVVILGLGELARRNNLHWSEITASAFLLAGALLISILLLMGIESPRLLAITLKALAQIVNFLLRPLIHKNYLSEDRALSFTSDVSEGLAALRHNRRWAIWPIFYAILGKILLMIVLFMCFMAFEIPVAVGTIVAGLSISDLFLLISPTPAGIGIVEGILAVSLHTLGLPMEDATVVTLAYRGFSFWMPFLIGMVTLRLLGRSESQPALSSPKPVAIPSLEPKE